MSVSSQAARAERRAMIALVAVFVLLVQMLAPAFAVAGPVMDGAICTSMGLQATAGDDAPSPPDHDCKACVCPVLSGDPPRTARVVRVAYAAMAAPLAEIPRDEPPPARAPPRPPGQGPPTFDA